MIDYNKFQKALKHLVAQYENYLTLDKSQPKLIKEAVAESVIQRFEVCFDCLWKVLKRYLTEEIGLPELEKTGPKPLFRFANENGLLQGKVEQWLTYTDLRNSTSHDYSGEKAQEVLASMGEFTKDAADLYQTMSGKNWE